VWLSVLPRVSPHAVCCICAVCVAEFTASLTYTLENYGSVNFYMFHGGTNFGFMNGANEQTENDQLKNGLDYLADVTSYGEFYMDNISDSFPQ